MSAQTADVLVIGGGIVGLSAALAMRLRGHAVVVLDGYQIDNSAHTDRVYAINRASYGLLEQLHVWPQLDPLQLSPYHHMRVWDPLGGGQIEFDCRMIQADRLGTIMHESALKKALLQVAQQQEIGLHEHIDLEALQTSAQGVHVQTAQGNWFSKLLIIADGSRSKARSLLNIASTEWSYHQQAIVAQVAVEKPHQQTAYQVFQPQGPLAFLPLAHAQQCSIVWSTRSAHSKHLQALSPAAFETAVAQEFCHTLGKVQLMGERRQFPLQMSHTKQYSGPSWVMMGDAAHNVHPLAGLGLNIGLADLSAWLSFYDTAGGRCSTTVLARYHRQRLHAVWQQVLLLQTLKTVFANPWLPVRWCRGLGLNTCNHWSLLKRFFIEHANDMPS